MNNEMPRVYSPKAKEAVRNELQSDVEKFLASGGEINVIDTEVSVGKTLEKLKHNWIEAEKAKKGLKAKSLASYQ